MRAIILLGTLVVFPASAEPAPGRVCVPAAVLDRMAAYLSGQPWRDVTGMMDAMRKEMSKPQPCPEPAAPSKQQ